MISKDERVGLRGTAIAKWQTDEREQAPGATLDLRARIDAAERRAESALPRRLGGARPLVVVAVDRVIDRVLLKRALRADGRTEVAADAHDGLEALAAIIVEQPDVAVFDQGVLHVDGLEINRLLRRYAPRTRSILLVDPEGSASSVANATVDVTVPRTSDRTALVELTASIATDGASTRGSAVS